MSISDNFVLLSFDTVTLNLTGLDIKIIEVTILP
jgi:hypothetical protein